MNLPLDRELNKNNGPKHLIENSWLLTIVRNELSSFSKAPRILEFLDFLYAIERDPLLLFQLFYWNFQK